MQSRRTALALVSVLGLAAVVAAPAGAADQTVLGKTYVVKDPKPGVDSTKRSIVVLGKELTTDDTVVGDPSANGATVEIVANGTTSTDQVFTLPGGASVSGSPGWKPIGSPPIGYTYKDAIGQNGPVKTALIKRTTSGKFIVKVTVNGALGPGPQPHITVLPPNTGTDGGMRFTINSGDSYCVMFGGAAGGAVKNSPTNPPSNKVFKIANPTAEAGCPAAPPSTTSTSVTTTSTSTVTSTTALVVGALVPTVGRFNYNLSVGLPSANSACNTNFPGAHACSYAELQSGEANGQLVGLNDTASNPVASLWAIDSNAAPLSQCNDDTPGSGTHLNWEYPTAHTASRGQRVALNNGTGALGALQTGVQCNFSGTSNVGCCQ